MRRSTVNSFMAMLIGSALAAGCGPGQDGAEVQEAPPGTIPVPGAAPAGSAPDPHPAGTRPDAPYPGTVVPVAPDTIDEQYRGGPPDTTPRLP